MWFDETGLPWVPPSPGMPTLGTAIVYPGTCLFEGTNMSEGRGTSLPFEWVGAPWLDAEGWARELNELRLPGVRFRPVAFTPSSSKHAGSECYGVQIHVLDRNAFRPVRTGLAYAEHCPQPWRGSLRLAAIQLGGKATTRRSAGRRPACPRAVERERQRCGHRGRMQRGLAGFQAQRMECLCTSENSRSEAARRSCDRTERLSPTPTAPPPDPEP